LIAGKTPESHITGIEIQENIAEMAARSIKLNNMEDKISILKGDIKKSVEIFGKSIFDVVVTNPPYMNCGAGLTNSIDTKAISRHEILCTLEDIISSAAAILSPGGQFAMVHRPERLVDIMCLMRKFKIEPKYLRFVHPSPYKKPNLILIKGSRGGNPHIKMLPPLYIHNEKGEFSEEINKIYCRGDYQID
jgi:tRNA1(Val) A37 N6-methylase TrmN6